MVVPVAEHYGDDPVYPDLTLWQWLRFVVRLLGFALVSTILLLVFLILNGIEKLIPLKIAARTPKVWGKCGLFFTGLRVEQVGTAMKHGGAIVSNHISWLDIFALHSRARIYFVAKAEVRKWPLIGLLATATGTEYIERRQSHAKRHHDALLARLDRGDRLCFFPEGTSTDGRRVLPFKSTLFSVFHSEELLEHAWVQPVTLTYFAPPGQDRIFYGWGGDMSFGTSLRAVLGLSRGGVVRVTFHEPVAASNFDSRKALARYCGEVVRQGLMADLGLQSSEATGEIAPSP